MNKNKLFWLSLLSFGLFTFLPKMIIAQMECITPDSPPPQNFTGTSGVCSNLIDQDGSESFPLITVKMAIHFVAGEPDSTGAINFYDGSPSDWNKMNGTTNAIAMINHCNELLEDLHDNPNQPIDYIGDTRIRFEVVPNFEDGVYFWNSWADYQPVNGVLNAVFIDEYCPNCLVTDTTDARFSLRGLACGIDNDCNLVRQWGWQSSEFYGDKWNYWNFAGLLNHEVFHVLGLRHVHRWNGSSECHGIDIDFTTESPSGWVNGSKNTMNYGNCQCALSPCQWSHIYSNCYDNHFSFTEIECNQNPIDIVVTQDQTWDERVIVTGNVVLEDGVTLTITCDVELNTNSQIHVHPNAKLIVDGGNLTSMKQCNVSYWKGIKVYGGNSDFDVKFTNGAVIENTSEAAVSMFAPEPWPAITNYGNGILHADNTTFNNIARIAELMSWSALPNSSYVTDCVQNGGKWSISNWNCQGILIKDNVFNDISNECVVTDRGSFLIEGNEFNSGRSDILYNNTSASISSRVKENTFNGLNIGYNARGTTYAQNEIHNNNFYTGEIDVMNDGHNQYDLYKNNINATFGSASFDNGGGIADVHNNDFSGNLAGTIPSGVNDDYNFYLNCYSATFTDNYIDGNVSPIIHYNGEAANNCFTHSGNNNSSVNDIGGSPDPFTYLEPDDEVVNCADAVLAHANVNREPFGDFIDADCGSGLPGGGATDWNYCFPDRYNYGDVYTAYGWLLNRVKEIEDNPHLTEEQKEQLISIYFRCFKRVRGYLFEWHLINGQFGTGRSLFADDESDDAKVFIYSSYISEGDLVTASNYLDTLENDGSLSVQLSDFIALQRINLSRIPYGPYYNASAAELELVKSIAYKTHSYAGYGKALHYVLTGEIISSEIPTVLRNEITPRSEDRGVSASNVHKVYPNPFNTTLNIEVSGYDEIDIVVYDFLGRMVYNNSSDQPSLSISTEDWKDGMYIINVRSEGEVIFTDKVVLIH